MNDYSIEYVNGVEYLVNDIRNFQVRLPRNWYHLPLEDTDRLLRMLDAGRLSQSVFQEMVDDLATRSEKKPFADMLIRDHNDMLIADRVSDTLAHIYEEERNNDMVRQTSTYTDWRKNYSQNIQHLTIPEELMKAIDPSVYSFSSWATESPLSIGGFNAYVIEALKLEQLIESIMDCPIVESIHVPYIVVSRYNTPGNIRNDRYATLAITSDDNKLNFFAINQKEYTGSILVSLTIETSAGSHDLILDCDCAKRSLPLVTKCFGDDFSVMVKTRVMEKFIHDCKTNALGNYNPSIAYTKIDKEW